MAKIKILIVEDEIIVAEDIKHILVKSGYDVTGIAKSGVEATRSVKKTLPDLILMDIKIKGKTTGIDVAKKIAKTHHIPIIYITAFHDEKTLHKVKLTTPYGYLFKPIRERELVTTIELAVYKHQIEKKIKHEHNEFSDLISKRDLELEKLSQKLAKEISDRERAEEIKEQALIDLNTKVKEVASLYYDAQILKNEMLRSIIEQDYFQTAKKKAFEALTERVKEFNLIQNITELLHNSNKPVHLVMEDIIKIIPSGFQRPDKTGARLQINNIEYRTSNYKESNLKILSSFFTSNGEKGFLEIVCLDKPLKETQEVFLEEENQMIKSLTIIIKSYIDNIFNQTRLNEQISFLNHVIDSMPGPLYYIEPSGIITGCNHAFEAFTGLSKSDAVGKNIRDILPETSAETLCRFDDLLLKHPNTKKYDAVIQTGDNKSYAIKIQKATITGTDNEIRGVVTSISLEK
jgi:two-component system, response regulator PdtaR